VNGLLNALANFCSKVLQTCSGFKTLLQNTPAAAFKATQLRSQAEAILCHSCTFVVQQKQQ
jgi:hypothetical protein